MLKKDNEGEQPGEWSEIMEYDYEEGEKEDSQKTKEKEMDVKLAKCCMFCTQYNPQEATSGLCNHYEHEVRVWWLCRNWKPCKAYKQSPFKEYKTACGNQAND